MKTSVIIPTKNESTWLERTLAVLSASSDIHEIIIVDNDCDERISRIASNYSCLLMKDTTPARSRNTGAKGSAAEILVFVDADILVPPACMRRAITCLEDNEDIGLVYFRIRPMTGNAVFRFLYTVMHYYFKLLSHFGRPQGIGNFIAVRRRVFDAIGGFDETIEVAEDADFFRRASGVTRVSYISEQSVYASTRRFNIENPYLYALKCVLWAVLRMFGAKRSIVGYKWEKYADSTSRIEERWIKKQLPELYNFIAARVS